MSRNILFGCRVHLGKGELFSKLIDRSTFIERHGYDLLLVDDHILYGTSNASAPDPFSTAALLIGRTNRVRVAVAVTDFVRRHPAIVAQSSATITNMAPGRFVLGLGAGDPMNHIPFGLPTDHRFVRFREGVRVAKMLWRSGPENPVSYRGPFHYLEKAYLQAGRSPPLYFAAFGERMLDLTGEEADGWIPHCHTPESYRSNLERILVSAERAGRKEENIVPSYYTAASVSSNREEADAGVIGAARYFLALIPEALREIDPSVEHPGRIWEKVPDPREQRKIISQIGLKIPEEVALRTVVHGTPSDCVEQISQYVKQGCRMFHLMFTPSHGLWSGDEMLPMIKLFAKEVIPFFRADSTGMGR